MESSTNRERIGEILTFFLAVGAALAFGYYTVRAPSLLVVLAVAITALIFLFKRWNIIILLFILSGSIISYSPFSLGGTVFVAEYLLIFLFVWLILINQNKVSLIVQRLKSPWMLFLFILLINFFRNPRIPQILGGDPQVNGVGFAYFLHGLTLICGLIMGPLIFQNSKQIKQLFWGLAVFFVIALGFSWASYLWGVSSVFVPGYGGKVFIETTEFGTITRFGYIGTYAAYLLPLALAFLPNRKWLLKLGALFLLFVSTVISGGRTQLVAFVIILVAYVYLNTRKLGLAALLMGSFVVLYVGIFALEINKTYPELNRFAPGYTSIQFEEKINGISASRIGVYEASFALIKTNPIFGIGPATEARIKKDLDTFRNDSIAHAREGTHATFINIATILGIPALLIYLSALIPTILISLRMYWSSRTPFEKSSNIYILLFFLSSVILYLTSGSSNGGNLYFYFVIGLVEVLAIMHSSQPGNQRLISSN